MSNCRQIVFLSCLLLSLFSAEAFAENCTKAVEFVSQGNRQKEGGEEAQKLYVAAIAECPNLAEAHYNLGVSYLKANRADSAITSIKQAITFRREASFFLALGNALVAENQLEEALEAYRQAQELDPRSALSRLGEAAVLSKLSRDDKAEEVLRSALQDDPENAAIYYNLGIVLEHQGRADEARISYKSAIERNGNFVEAYLLYADLCLQVGQVDEADRAVRTATILAPHSLNAWYLLARVLDRQQNFIGAIDALKKVEEKASSDPQFLLNYGISLIRLGEKEQGLAKIVEAAEKSAEDSQFQGALGWGLLQVGELEKAEAALRKALELDPANALALNNLGVLQELKGEEEVAREHYLQAGKLSGDIPEIKINLERIGDSR